MTDPIGGFVCEHGRVRRKCEVCELVDAERENARLRALLAEAALQIEHLHGKLGAKTGSGNVVLARIDAALRGEETK